MKPVVKSFVWTGALVCAAAAVYGGAAYRDKADLHLHAFSGSAGNNRNLLASNSTDAPDVSATDFFEQISELLKRNYVDPISDDNKLTTGAIRGMVSSLEDPDCLFMDPKQYQLYRREQQGEYEGIGVDLALEIPSNAAKTVPGEATPLSSDSPVGNKIPALVVAAVVPGGPADRAGVKAGDSVESIDGHWVLNPFTLQIIRDLQDKIAREKDQTEKEKDTAKLTQLRLDLRKKIDSSLMPLKARDRLISGTSGSVVVEWNRGASLVDNSKATLLKTSLARAASHEAAATREANGTIALHFLPGAASVLKTLIAGGGPVTLDLRNNDLANFEEMRKCLAVVAPAGSYGEFANEKNKKARAVQIEDGVQPRPLKLIADESTRGVAEAFALALESKHLATVAPGNMSPNRNLIEVIELPDGSAYTLVVGRFVASSQAEQKL